jgi:hypothetical protein
VSKVKDFLLCAALLVCAILAGLSFATFVLDLAKGLDAPRPAHSHGHYGKLPAPPRPAPLKLRERLAAPTALPAAPDQCLYFQAVASWPMYANDSLGDCTLAAAAHQIQLWTALASAPVTPDLNSVVTAYSALSGYDPSTGAGADNGVNEGNVVAYWQSVGVAGNQCTASAAINPSDVASLRQCIYLFGGVQLGIQVRRSAESQFDAGHPWSYVGPWFNPIQGYHQIVLVGYDANYFYGVTWGAVVAITPEFIQYQADEAYAVVDTSFLGADGVAVNGLTLPQLQAALAAISGQ